MNCSQTLLLFSLISSLVGHKDTQKGLIGEFLAQFGDDIALALVFPIEYIDGDNAVAGVFGDDFRKVFLIDHHGDVSASCRIPCNLLVEAQNAYDAPQGGVDQIAHIAHSVFLFLVRVVLFAEDRQNIVRITSILVFGSDFFCAGHEWRSPFFRGFNTLVGNLAFFHVDTGPCQIGGIDWSNTTAVEAEQEQVEVVALFF